MKNVEEIKEYLREHNMGDTVVFENESYAEAFIGTCCNRAVYLYSKMVRCLTEKRMSYEEAIEFIEYNTMGSLLNAGDGAPIVVYDLDID